MIGMLSSHLMQSEIIVYGLVRKCVKLSTFSYTIFILDLGSKLYRQIVGIPMGTNCSPLVADLFCSVMRETSCCPFQSITNLVLFEAFNSTSRYLDDLLNIDNNFFDIMVSRIYSSELQLNKANVSDAEAPFWIYIYLYRMVL